MGSSKPTKVETLTPQQQAFQGQALGLGSQAMPAALQQIFAQLDPERTAELFEQGVAGPQRKAFQEQLLPQLLESAEGLGAKGGTALTGQIARQAGSLEEALQSQLAQTQLTQQQQGIANLLGLAGAGQSAAQAPQFALQQASLPPGLQALLALTGAGIGAGGQALGGFLSRQR